MIKLVKSEKDTELHAPTTQRENIEKVSGKIAKAPNVHFHQSSTRHTQSSLVPKK